jgi:hypothetical protein
MNLHNPSHHMLISSDTEMPHVNVHRGGFNTVPFFSIRLGDSNSLDQALPEGILQMQPRLGRSPLASLKYVSSMLTVIYRGGLEKCYRGK